MQDEPIRELYQRRLEQKFEEFVYETPKRTYKHVKSGIKNAAVEALWTTEEK